MSVERFQIVLKLASLGNDDKVWFERWLRRYAMFVHQPENLPLLVSQERVKQFCRTLLARKVPAWQRLQAVRASEFYGQPGPSRVSKGHAIRRHSEFWRTELGSEWHHPSILNGALPTFVPCRRRLRSLTSGSLANAIFQAVTSEPQRGCKGMRSCKVADPTRRAQGRLVYKGKILRGRSERQGAMSDQWTGTLIRT